MRQTLCDHCDRVMGGQPKKQWLVVRNEAFTLDAEFCSFNCLHLWAYEKFLEACAIADPAPMDEDIYGPDSGRTDPELLMEAADMERKRRREL